MSYYDFVADALAASEFLEELKEIQNDNITMIGHSQGGQVIPFTVQDNSSIKDIIILAGPYRSIDALYAYQVDWMRYLCETLGYTEQQTQNAVAQMEQDAEDLAELRAGTFSGSEIGGVPVSFWLEWMQAGDETPGVVRNLDTGVFVLQGDYDWNVPTSEAEMWEEELASHPDATVTILDELTHSFVRITQPEWTQIEADDIGDQVDPEAIDAIVDWMNR